MKLESEFNADQSEFFQSRGALFALDELSEEFLLASENAGSVAGVGRTEDLLGKTVRDVLGRDVTHALRNAATMPSLERRRQHIGQFDLRGASCDLSAFRSGTSIVLEAVPKVGEHDPSAYDVMKDVEVLTDVLLAPEDPKRIIVRLAALMRTISGFHCVVLEENTGQSLKQIAVSGRSRLANAKCEGREQLHSVHDIHAPRVGLTVREGQRTPPLDMAGLRVPAEDYLQSCREIGVASCACIGLRWDNRHQGTLKFLHEMPRTPNKRTQFAVSHLAPLLGQRMTELG